MIQRYNIYNHPIARISYQVASDDNGEWVRWEDVEKLMSEGRILSVESVKMIEEMYEIAMKGNKS
jgi:hypothetical protein